MKRVVHLFTGFIRDTIERKQAEEKIQEQKAELRQLLDLYTNHAALDYPEIRVRQIGRDAPESRSRPDYRTSQQC